MLTRQVEKLEPFAEGAGVVLVVAYTWWTTGLHPFTDTSYAAIALPAAFVAGLHLFAPPVRTNRETRLGAFRRAPGLGGTAPIASVLLLAIGLEAAGLALGGRSVVVPTLSTVLDHALRWHGTRAAIFLAWLGVGLRPLFRVGRQPPPEPS